MFGTSTSRRCGPVLPRGQRTFYRPYGLTDRAVASHEAGHLVAAWGLGYRLQYGTIRPVDSREGDRFEGRASYVFDLIAGRPMHRAIVAIAGPLGEQLRHGGDFWQFAGRQDDQESDRFTFAAAISHRARQIGHAEPIILRALERIAIDRAGRLLDTHFDALIELERQLWLRVDLDAGELAAILGPSPAPAKKR